MYLRRLSNYARFVPIGSGTLSVGAISDITNDTKYNGFPSICRMANGSLLVAYVKSNNPGDDNSGTIVRKISSNDGSSWGSEATLASDATFGCLNPGLVTLASGRVLLMYNLYDAPNTPVDAVRVIYSDNNGSTWSSPYTVNSSFTDWCASGTTRPIQLADGTIILTVYGQDIGNTHASAHALSSTDDGATFGSEVTIANGQTDGRHYYEPSLELQRDATILCHLRTTDAAGSMYQNSSSNSGATWSAPASIFGGWSPSNVYRRFNRTLVATVRGNAAAKVQAFTSVNAGSSWVDQGVLDAGVYVLMNYASAIDRLDESLLVVYGVDLSHTNADIRQVILTEAYA